MEKVCWKKIVVQVNKLNPLKIILLIFLLGFFLILAPVYAESLPDYDKPFAPIYTDKTGYSWTDKIIISINNNCTRLI